MTESPYFTTLAHIALALQSFWSIRSISAHNQDFTFAFAALEIHSLYALIGIFTYGNPEHGHRTRDVYRLLSSSIMFLGFPLICTNLFVNYNYSKEFTWLHLGFAIIPILCSAFSTKSRTYRSFLDVTIGFYIASATYVSLANENYYGISMSLSYALNYFVIGNIGTSFGLPAVDLFTYGLCFFNYFACSALKD